MTDDREKSVRSEAGTKTGDVPEQKPRKPLSPAARRALAEAEERRKAHAEPGNEPEREVGGRGGRDPARFGDWEIKGRAIDF